MMAVIPATGKVENCGPGLPGHKCKTLFEKKKAKRASGVAQVVENLPSKCKALSSNPSSAKRKVGSIGCPTCPMIKSWGQHSHEWINVFLYRLG
jgi:hypothetical protein